MKNSVYQNILIHVSYMIEEEAKERAKKTAHDNDTYHGGLFSMLQTMHAVQDPLLWQVNNCVAVRTLKSQRQIVSPVGVSKIAQQAISLVNYVKLCTYIDHGAKILSLSDVNHLLQESMHPINTFGIYTDMHPMLIPCILLCHHPFAFGMLHTGISRRWHMMMPIGHLPCYTCATRSFTIIIANCTMAKC